MAIATEIQWQGTKQEQQVARLVYDLLAARGRFFSDDAPIRQNLSSLEQHFREQKLVPTPRKGTLAELIERALTANPEVFAREEADKGVVFATTKRGVPPTALGVDTRHTFRQRLFEGARKPTEEDLKAVKGIQREIPDVILTLPEPVRPVVPFDVDLEEEPDQPEAAVVAEAPPVARYLLAGGTTVDLTQDAGTIATSYHNAFRTLLAEYLPEDYRFARFGDEYFAEDRLERLSRGQLGDIKEYINERGEPVTDEEILSEGLRRPLQDGDYNLWRFTINYRLMRERKDFRFVGTSDDRLWATANLPLVGESYRKPSEIAQDYRYLADPELADDAQITASSAIDGSGRLELRHVLTYYEFENGVLPIGWDAERLMPRALVEDQTVVMLRIQDPQNYAQYLAELRLASGNRGTHIAGLEELFQSTLVPGAVCSLVQGAASNMFTIEYASQPAQEARLLQYDERRDRWMFGPVVYECPTEPSWLLTEDRVGALAGRRRASDAERRRPETLLQHAFEVVGEASGPGVYTALLDDLLPVANIERPFSRRYLESIIRSPQYPQFAVEDESLMMVSHRS